MLVVKILGPGCANCRKLEAIAREAIAAAGLQAEVLKVKDMAAIMAYELTSTPGSVVDERLVCSGRIPTIAEVRGWLGAEGSGPSPRGGQMA
jgi:small redox-active disulfide protein 2